MQVFVWIFGNLAPGKKFYKVKETENSSIFFLIQKCLRTLKIAIFLPKIILQFFFFFRITNEFKAKSFQSQICIEI